MTFVATLEAHFEYDMYMRLLALFEKRGSDRLWSTFIYVPLDNTNMMFLLSNV